MRRSEYHAEKALAQMDQACEYARTEARDGAGLEIMAAVQDAREKCLESLAIVRRVQDRIRKSRAS